MDTLDDLLSDTDYEGATAGHSAGAANFGLRLPGRQPPPFESPSFKDAISESGGGGDFNTSAFATGDDDFLKKFQERMAFNLKQGSTGKVGQGEDDALGLEVAEADELLMHEECRSHGSSAADGSLGDGLRGLGGLGSLGGGLGSLGGCNNDDGDDDDDKDDDFSYGASASRIARPFGSSALHALASTMPDLTNSDGKDNAWARPFPWSAAWKKSLALSEEQNSNGGGEEPDGDRCSPNGGCRVGSSEDEADGVEEEEVDHGAGEKAFDKASYRFRCKADEANPFHSASALLNATTSVQTTADGGTSTAPNSEGGGTAGPSQRSSPRSPPSSDTRCAFQEDELCAHSALVNRSVDTVAHGSRSPRPEFGLRKSNDMVPHSSNGSAWGTMQQAHSLGGTSDAQSPEDGTTCNSRTEDGLQSPEGLCGMDAPHWARSDGARSDSVHGEEVPINASGAYKLDTPASRQASTVPADAAQGVAAHGHVARASAAAAGAGNPKARPFLKKGTRMPRSDLPRSRGSSTKPITNPNPSAKSLRLQPRATSAPAGARGAPAPTHKEELTVAEQEPLVAASGSSHQARRKSAPRFEGGVQQQHNTADTFADALAALQGDDVEGYGARARQARQLAKDIDSANRANNRGQSQCQLMGGAEFGSDWADTVPWDCRDGSLDDDFGVDDPAMGSSGGGRGGAVPLTGEPPTSDIVKSYFQHASSSSNNQRPSNSQPLLRGAQQAAAAAAGSSARHSHWEGNSAHDAIYGSSMPGTDEASLRKGAGFGPACGGKGETPPKVASIAVEAAMEEEMKQQLQALDDQVKWYERERENLKKLQAQTQQAERDFAREREKLLREVEAERRALHDEFDTERAAIRKERKRLGQGVERQRQQLAEDREAQEERKRLQERAEHLEEEIREKEKRWQRTVDRLQRQIGELNRKNQELTDEVQRANQQAHQTQHSSSWQHDSRRSASAVASRGRQPPQNTSSSTPNGSARMLGKDTTPIRSRPTDTTPTRIRPTPPTASAATAPSRGARASVARPHSTSGTDSHPAVRRSSAPAFGGMEVEVGDAASAASSDSKRSLGASALWTSQQQRAKDIPAGIAGVLAKATAADATAAAVADEGDAVPVSPTQEVRDVRRLDGRTERLFVDGRREVEFANGLKKVMWADGRTSVLFQNGDRKEIHSDGVVIYCYAATGAVQTTLTDGSELYRFADGQTERHNPDGSKEIKFPNGTSKKIFADGSEEVCFADGAVRRTSAATKAAEAEAAAVVAAKMGQ